MTLFDFQQFISRNKWIFAKTYADFCPHEYVVKERLSTEEQRIFGQIVAFIRKNGFLAIYGKMDPKPYYIVGDYYYWTMGDPVEETVILNRARLSDYTFTETENGLVVEYNKM